VRRTLLIALACGCALVACSDDGGHDAQGDLYPDLGPPPDRGAQEPCAAEWIDALFAQDAVSTGDVTTTDVGDGVMQTLVDASAGGMQSAKNNPWVYISLGDGQRVDVTDLDSKDSSAWDLALLTIDLINRFPEHYAYYSERSFTFNDIEQPNRNRLLWRDRTVDGVKTGHTEAAGYCLVASALRGNMRLISVVMGTDSEEARMRESQKLLSYGFRYFETQKLYDAGVPLKTARIYYGESEELAMGVAEPVSITIPRSSYEDLEPELIVLRTLEAPINAGDEVGELVLGLYGEEVYRAPLVALADVPEAGIFTRLSDWLSLFFADFFSSDSDG